MKISAIICCYNEELWVGQAITLLSSYPSVSEIICVNDGSRDKTETVLKSFGKRIKLISYKKNMGKGYAMSKGIAKAAGDLVVFLDAHHLNIKENHVATITKPLISNQADCVLGTTVVNLFPDPFWRFTGFRAYRKKDLLPYLKEMEKTRFGVETYLNEQFKNKKTKIIKYKDLIHLVKQQIMPPGKMLKSYLTEFQEMLTTMAKVKGVSGKEKLKKLIEDYILQYLNI